MADVWILVNPQAGDEWKSTVTAAVLPNGKVLGSIIVASRINRIKQETESWWRRYHPDEGEVPIQVVYDKLQNAYAGIHSSGVIVPMEKAREYIKQSGGL